MKPIRPIWTPLEAAVIVAVLIAILWFVAGRVAP